MVCHIKWKSWHEILKRKTNLLKTVRNIAGWLLIEKRRSFSFFHGENKKLGFFKIGLRFVEIKVVIQQGDLISSLEKYKVFQ